jgi:beta-glucosidase
LKVDENGVSFKLKNIGKAEGQEVAQLYIGKKDSFLIRPKKELKGFLKVGLKPGEEKMVTIPFDDKSFRYFNVKTNGWEIENGAYQIYIGSSVEDIKLTGEITKVGTSEQKPYEISQLPDYISAKVQNIPDAEFEKLLGRQIPPHELTFVKKNRIIVTSNTTMSELRYAKGWTGRFFARAVRHGIAILRFFGNRGMANMLIMGVQNQTVKVLSRMTNGAMCWEQLNGLLMMFNGHYHKGLHHFFKAGRANKKMLKEMKKQKAAEEKKA